MPKIVIDKESLANMLKVTIYALTGGDYDKVGEVVADLLEKMDYIELPKGHGRLCDLDAALECVDDDSMKDCDAKWQAIRLFEWAMSKRVVLEADKEEE